MKPIFNARSMFAIAAIAISTSVAAHAGYKFHTIDVPGAVETKLVGINNKGVAVGSYTTSTGQVFGWSEDLTTGAMTTQINDPNGSTTELTGINDDGAMVGNYWSPAGHLEGVIFDTDGIRDIDYPSCTTLTISAVDNNRDFGGNCYYSQNGQAHVAGWLSWYGGGAGICTLNNSVTSISDNGNLWGGSCTNAGDPVIRGYVQWYPIYQAVLSYPGAISTRVTGTNDSFVAVGSYAMTANGTAHGFLLQDVRSSYTYTTVDVPHAKSTFMGKINNMNWIVGSYLDSAGKTHAFYGTPAKGTSTLDQQ